MLASTSLTRKTGIAEPKLFVEAAITPSAKRIHQKASSRVATLCVPIQGEHCSILAFFAKRGTSCSHRGLVFDATADWCRTGLIQRRALPYLNFRSSDNTVKREDTFDTLCG